MKRTDKNIYILCGILILFLFPSRGSAQEYIKSLKGMKVDTSIVRNIDDTYKLSYVESSDNKLFLMFDNNSISTANMYLDPNNHKNTTS